MNEQALKDAYDLFVSNGYSDSIDDFKKLISTNPQALKDSYDLFSSNGYSDSVDDYKALLGVGGKSTPVKKKFALESSSEVGSSESPKYPKPTTEEFESQFKKGMAKQKAVPKDLSGKPLYNTEVVNKNKDVFKKIQIDKKEKEEEVKKQENIFDKQLNIKPKVEDSQYLKDRLNAVNTNLINKEEEYVVPELEYQFGDLGFKFEQSGIGDNVKVTAPNGKISEISLDNLFSSKSKDQSTVLQKFIKDNTPAKGLFVLEKTMREQDKKFNSQKQVDDSIKAISDEVNNLNSKQKQFLIKKNQIEKQIAESGFTEQLKQQSLVLNEEMKSILQEEERIKQKGKKLDSAVGKYSIAKSKQGTWFGGIVNAINEGASSISAGTTSLISDLSVELTPTGYGMLEKDLKDISVDIAKKIGVNGPANNQTLEQWKKTLTEDQLDKWEDQVDDYKKKDFKSDIIPAIRIGNREVFGDAETTKQWSNLKEQDFWGGAILGVAKSLPAMIGGAGPVGIAQRTAAMYSQVSDGLSQEMENDPDFKDVTENEKLAITLPIGIVGAVLENVGLKNIKGSQGVINNIALRALGRTSSGVTARTFRELVENEVDSMVAKGLLTITAAGAAEFETGAAQELSETTFKAVYNKLKGEVDPVTGEKKKMFDTPDSIGDLIENVAVAGAQEAVGGFVLGVPTAVSVAYTEKGFLKMDDASFEMFSNMANDEKMQSAYVTSLKEKITRGELTTAEAKDQLNNYRNSAGLYRQLPEGLSTQQKKEAMNLLKEKKDLENYVEGKDSALVVKQKNRITEINDSLTKLSETDAVQEQSTTEVPVQSEAITSETLETGVPESGPEVVTEQSTQEEVVEPLKDRESTAKALETANDDAYVKILNDYFTGGSQETTTQDVSNSYHSSKENNGNPELVKAVEELLAPKAEITQPQTIIEEQTEPQVVSEQVETAPVAEKVNDFSTKSIEDLEKRQAELEGAKSFTEESKEFGEIDKELEKREWQSVLNAPLNEVNSVVDDLMIKEKEMPNGYGSYIEKSDAKETKEVVEKYSQEVSKLDAKKDFKDAFFGRPESWYADGLKLRESVRVFIEQGGTFKELLQGIQKEFEQDGFSEEDAAVVIKNKLDRISRANEETTQEQAETAPVVEEVNDLLELDTKDQTSLKRVLDYLDSLDSSLDLDPNELNDVTRVMAIGTAKAVVKTLKALVKAGITLQEAIKAASEIHSVDTKDVLKAFDVIKQGEKQISAPSPLRSDIYAGDGRIISMVKDIKKITMTEKELLVKQIRDKIRGAKDVIKTTKEISQQLVKEIKELETSGKITPTQAINMISKFSKVNMLNETSVSNFIDYMSKVFADADYDNKINVAKGKLKAAKKNINTKIGIADGLAFPLQTLFSINPGLIPIKNLERYIELVDMFSGRKSVLKLDEISKVINDVNDIINEINNEQSLIPELSFRINNSNNQVLKDGKLDYAATIKKMIKEGEITQEEADLMIKYKKEIVPQEAREKKTDEEIESERKELESEAKNSTVDSSGLPTRDERIIAKRIAEHLKKPFIKQLSDIELSNLIKAIDNINNGYLPHQAELILEKLNGLEKGKVISGLINKANLKRIAQIVNTTYNKIKSKITSKDGIFEMIRRTPLYNIDQILGDFKTQDLYNSLLGSVAQAESKFSFELKTIEEKLRKAQDKVAKSFKLNPFESTVSSYKIKTYLIQLEHDTNPGDLRVNQASEYIKATIKHINKLNSQYNENDVKALEGILKDFAPDGNIDIKKLYDSFNSAEKDAIKTLQEINKADTGRAEFTGSVIRGNRINPLNNHTYISVLSEDSKDDLDSGASFADSYNQSIMPSTKAKNLTERTAGVKPINFDAYSTAHKSSKYVLLDYYLTGPVRTARKAMKAAEANLEKDGEMSKEQRRIFNAINDAFELAVSDLVKNSYIQSSEGQQIVDYISKQGYRAVLSGIGRSGVELLSNLGFVAFDPFTFSKGIEYMGIILSEDLPAIMNATNSIQTNRVNASGLSGRMVDTGILNQAIGIKSSKTQGKFINKVQQIWNLTGKKWLNATELTADVLITTPDKLVMKPYWMGSFVNELENQLGRKVTKSELKKIAENNEEYMDSNEESIKVAREIADKKSILMGATKNGFTGLLRGKTRPEDKAFISMLKNFNSFMTNFMIYEYNAAKTGVMAAIGDGTMSKSEGAAVLGGVITRMTVYNLLAKAATSGMSSVFGLVFGLDDDEEEEDKTADQLLTQSLASTFASLTLGRDFGNISKTVINYSFEKLITKEYLEGLRTGEYDPYKDAVLFNTLQSDPKTGEVKFWENIPNFMGSYGPMAKTAALGVKAITADEKKTEEAKERQEKERNIRLPLEILGNAGYIPLYKEIRKSVMDDIYKDLKKKEENKNEKEKEKEIEKEKLSGYKNKTEMKKNNPNLYKETFRDQDVEKSNFGNKKFGKEGFNSKSGFSSKKFGDN
jgi:hypothetical protein